MSHFLEDTCIYRWIYVLICVCFTLIDSTGSWELCVPQCSQRQCDKCELLSSVSRLTLGRSPVYQAENHRKDETKNAPTLQWKEMLMQQFPLDRLHSLIYCLF